ncbi:hypothetical protein AG1IA_06584 [Rhizoctonia solani AG-1 IA]|uniref:Uncharacterized protein n=1 Tax=Thanatephorus cucumeris (strain AG1-IA) TaxID=983506 RepID=L8WSL7_THACA|nr:hypothetical protein AG1IA_06584 [Rhizoctonia solani AG-1 IA]
MDHWNHHYRSRHRDYRGQYGRYGHPFLCLCLFLYRDPFLLHPNQNIFQKRAIHHDVRGSRYRTLRMDDDGCSCLQKSQQPLENYT